MHQHHLSSNESKEKTIKKDFFEDRYKTQINGSFSNIRNFSKNSTEAENNFNKLLGKKLKKDFFNNNDNQAAYLNSEINQNNMNSYKQNTQIKTSNLNSLIQADYQNKGFEKSKIFHYNFKFFIFNGEKWLILT